MADEIVIGKIGLTAKGEYVPGELYDILDMVSHEGNSYVSKIQNNEADVTNTEAWLLAAEKGDVGNKGDTFTFEDLTTEQKEELKGDVIAYNSLDEADKDDLASRVPIVGVIEEGNTQAVSGGEVYDHVKGELALKADQADLVQLESEVEQFAYVKINNEVVNGNFENGKEGWAISNIADFSVIEGVASWNGLGTPSYKGIKSDITNVDDVKGHLLYNSMLVNTNSGGRLFVSDGIDGTNGIITSDNLGVWHRISLLHRVNNNAILFSVQPRLEDSGLSSEMSVTNFLTVDLTEFYGDGKEPSIEEFEAFLDTIPNNYFAKEYVFSQKEIVGDLERKLDDKVDKVEGKVLSDENYTLAEKEKLALLSTDAKLIEVVDNLSETLKGKALDATQGKILNEKIDNVTVPVINNLTSIDIDKALSAYQGKVLKDEMSNYSNEVANIENLVSSVIDEDISRVLSNELVATDIANKLNAKEVEYAPRLTSVENESTINSLQLLSIETANSNEVLNNVNYLGNKQNIHPKVLHFPSGWNGFKYWMAYTPYPFGDVTAENPCIAVSNDMIDWSAPAGLTNPLKFAPADGYNNDTHLVFRADTNKLEIWWRLYAVSAGIEYILRRTSSDGINWSPEEIVFQTSKSTTDGMVSPAIIFEEGKYKVWGCRGNHVIYRESIGDTVTSWTDDTLLNIDWTTQNLRPWHLDVIKTELGYEMIVCAFDATTGNNNAADLFYVLHKNDGSFTKPLLAIKRSTNPTAPDSESIYRSSFIKVDGKYYVFYSYIGKDLSRGMSLSIGERIDGLNGFTNFKKPVVLPGQNEATITSGTIFTDYDVSNIDTLYFTTTGTSTVNSFSGGYKGKRLTLVIVGSNPTVQLVNSSRLALPGGLGLTLSYKEQIVLDLICTNAAGKDWRANVRLSGASTSTVSLAAGQTLTNYDLGVNDTIIVTGAGVLTVDSLVSTHAGKKIHIILSSSDATVLLKQSSRLFLPGLEDFTLTSEHLGMTLVCSSLAYGGVWRGFV